jgi:hypothetical protein
VNINNFAMIDLGPRLYLEIIDCPSIPAGTKYEIDQIGLKNTLRTEKDGNVYVGSLDKDRKG